MNKFSRYLILALSIFFTIFGLTVAAISLIAPSTLEAIEDWLNSTVIDKALDNYFAPSLIVLVVIVCISAFLPLIFGAIDKAKKRKLLKTIGQPGLAKIISITNTGIVVNNSNYFLKMVLEVPGGSHAEITTLVNIVSMPRVDSTIKVIYDPSNPQIVLPEWDML